MYLSLCIDDLIHFRHLLIQYSKHNGKDMIINLYIFFNRRKVSNFNINGKAKETTQLTV